MRRSGGSQAWCVCRQDGMLNRRELRELEGQVGWYLGYELSSS
jgi:hypothetical protein